MHPTLERRQLLDLALAAREHYLSPHTKLVHYRYEGQPFDTIPIYENLCACLALFCSRQAELIAEAKNTLKKMLSFAVDEQFPIYLHNYPYVGNDLHQMRCSVVLFWIDHQFGHLLDTPLKPYLKALDYPLDHTDISPQALACQLMIYQIRSAQMSKEKRAQTLSSLTSYWHPTLHRYTGDLSQERRVGHVPTTTLYELYMSQYFGELSKWALALQPVHLLAALIFPFDNEEIVREELPLPLTVQQKGFYEMSWGDRQQNISLALFHPGLEPDLICTLSEDLPDDRSGSLEPSLFLTRLPGVQILVNGQKATAFRLSDQLSIITPEHSLALSFEVVGQGQFIGHISRGNRPSQLENKQKFAAYDWQIGLRTLTRDEHCRVRIRLGPLNRSE